MKLNIYQTVKRYRSIPVILAALFVVISVFSILHAETDKNTAEPVKQRPDVGFLDNYHDQHMESLDCLSCHHVYEDGKNVLEQEALENGDADTACASCHSGDAELDLTDAYHRQCIGCHDKMRKAKEKTGPCLCGECHIRNRE